MSSATCVEAIKTGENNMKTSWRSIEPKGIEDYLKDLCVIYRGEVDNPHDVNAILDEERKIQSLPTDDESIARKLYDFVVRKKLERVKEFGIDLTDIYERIKKVK